MYNLYKEQKIAREKEVRKILTKKETQNPYILFPLRLETRYRTVAEKDNASINYQDYIAIIEDLRVLQDEFYKSRKDVEMTMTVEKLYKILHNIHTRIDQVDVIKPIERRNLIKIVDKVLADIEELPQVRNNDKIFDKIIRKRDHIYKKCRSITLDDKYQSAKINTVISNLKALEESLTIVSVFSKTLYRSISHLQEIKAPINSLVNGNDNIHIDEIRLCSDKPMIPEQLDVQPKGRQKVDKFKIYLNIGTQKFLLERKNEYKKEVEEKSIEDSLKGVALGQQLELKKETYCLNINPDNKFTLFDLENEIIYLSVEGNSDSEQREEIAISRIEYLANNSWKTYESIIHGNSRWEKYGKKEYKILQSSTGAYGRLKSDLLERVKKAPVTLEDSKMILKKVGQLNLLDEDEVTISSYLSRIVSLIPKVKENVANIYNPTEVEVEGRKIRIPYKNVPEEIKGSDYKTQKFLAFHQESLNQYYEMFCEEYLESVKEESEKIQKEYLGKRNSSRVNNLLHNLKEAKEDLELLSNFNKIPFRSTAHLERFKEPKLNLFTKTKKRFREVSHILIEVKEGQNNSGRMLFNIGRRNFLCDSQDAARRNGKYFFKFSIDGLTVDDLVNEMIYISYDNIPPKEQWQVGEIYLGYIHQEEEHSYLSKGKMQWNKPTEGLIKELQEMRGANPRLIKHLRTKCMRVQSLLQSTYNELSRGIPLWNENKREIEELLRYIANVSDKVQGNIKRLYNPKTIKQNHGVIKLSSSENSTRAEGLTTEEYLQLHQEALDLFFDVHCSPLLYKARKTTSDITRKGLIDKNIVEQSYHPSSLIAEGFELSSLLNESLLGIDEEGVGALVKNIRYIKEGVGGSSIVEKRQAKAVHNVDFLNFKGLKEVIDKFVAFIQRKDVSDREKHARLKEFTDFLRERGLDNEDIVLLLEKIKEQTSHSAVVSASPIKEPDRESTLISPKIYLLKKILKEYDKKSPRIVFYSEEAYNLLNRLLGNLRDKLSEAEKEQLYIKDANGEAINWVRKVKYPFYKVVEEGKKMYDRQLCVRIFPDNIFISNFEAPLSEEEFEDAKRFQVLWFIFSGNPLLEKGIWDSLVEKYGVHRASWLVRIFAKKMEANAPNRPFNDFAGKYLDHVNSMISVLNRRKLERELLIANLEEASTHLYEIRNKVFDYKNIPDVLYDQMASKLAEVKQALAFYERQYDLNSDYSKVNSEYMELWDKDTYALANFRAELDDFLFHLESKKCSLVELQKEFKEKVLDKSNYFENLPLLEKKKGDEVHEPVCPVLPDRFVFVGEQENGRVIKEVGRKVKKDLQLSFSVADEEILEPFSLNKDSGDITVEGGLRWMFDYDEAVRKGMAITVPLSKEEYDTKFKAVYVIGLQDEKEDGEGKKNLEELIRGHIYTENSLDLLKLGTPTNNLGNEETYEYANAQDLIDRRFQVEVVNRAKKPKTGSAAINLSNSLGLADDTFKYLNSYNMEGHRLNKTGSYLSKMFPESNMTDEKLKRFVKNLPDFIDNYVSPRGFLPSLFLSNMPYGVLPTTNFADLSFIKQNDVKDDEMFVVDMLEHLLINLSTAWDRAFHNNVHSMDSLKGKNGETSETNFMKLISAMPHSVDYKALEMMKNSLLLKDFTFKGNYKKLDSSSIRKYFKYAPENMVEKLDYFSYFPNAKMQRVELEDILTKIRKSVSDKSKSELRDLIDLFSYRLDAWFMALANYQLEQQRGKSRSKGIHIGAYGWLFDLERDDEEQLSQNRLRPLGENEKQQVIKDMKLQDNYAPKSILETNDGDSSLKLLDAKSVRIYEDHESEGVMLAPSISHAVTAAVMRSSYSRSKKNNEGDNRLSINLSSGRMQRAMHIINGVSNGLSVGAILGAQLERGLHEAYKEKMLKNKGKEEALELQEASEEDKVEMDKFIHYLRNKFPLTADVLKAKGSNEYTTQVVNGAFLLEKVFEVTKWNETDNDKNLGGNVIENFKEIFEFEIESTFNEKKCLANLIEQMADSYDALNDLILSEGVYQVVKGNRTALSALMNKLEKNSLIPKPEILDIPMDSVTVSQKIVLNFKGYASPQENNNWVNSDSIFAKAEPSLNHFVGELLGDASKIGVWMKSETKKEFVSLKEFGLSPLDYVYLSANEHFFEELLCVIYREISGISAGKVEIESNPQTDGNTTISDQRLFISSLRKVLQEGIGMKPSDFVHQRNQTGEENSYNIEQLESRLSEVLNVLQGLKSEVRSVISDNIAQNIRKDIKDKFEQKNFEKRYDYLTKENKLSEIIDVEHVNTIYFDGISKLLAKSYRFGLIEIAPDSTLNFELPHLEETPDESKEITSTENGEQNYLKAKIEQSEKEDKRIAAYNEKRAEILENRKEVLEQLVQVWHILEDKIQAYRKIECTDKDTVACVKEYNKIAEKLLVKNFKLYPLLSLKKQLVENDLQPLKAQLESEYKNTGTDNWKLEEWLMDLAKVRKETKSLQTVRMGAMLSDENRPQSLTPIQLPFKKGDDEWVGMEVADGKTLEDRESTVLWDKDSLYESVEGEGYVAGMVIDNWIELIPQERQQAGAVFNYDVPNAEPPQTILLAVSPEWKEGSKGTWSIEQLVDILKSTKKMVEYRLVEPEMINNNETLSRLLPMLSYAVPKQSESQTQSYHGRGRRKSARR